ncbi:MAG: diguanylate cyclase [Proteobacteria bacterium]|nr:diguanylate cyclase [Pseudomonadota bacterium]MBU1639499.1 diguanylate cyclase [Pseudomonadota bacterium]
MVAKKQSVSVDDLDKSELVVRLAHERDRLRRILDGLNEGVIIVDCDGIVTFANPAACLMLAWRKDYLDTKLKAIMSCCDGNTLPFLQRNGALAHAIREGSVLSGIERIMSKTSACFTVEYQAIALKEDDNIMGAAITLNNISERIMAEGALGEANKRLQRVNNELKIKNKRLQESAVTDSLTNLYNHRHIIERLQEHVSASERYQRDLSVMMFDIDFFKKVNDTYGHPFGDEVLEQVSNTLREVIRTVDIAGRYGGEEFLVVMPETGLSKAKAIAERIRLALEALTWKHPIKVTISAGVAMWKKCESASELISRADTLLYEAKQGGRNQIKG